jgi:hypothetical protein
VVAMHDDGLVSPGLQFGQPQRDFAQRNQPRSVDPRNGKFFRLPTVEQQNGWLQYRGCRLGDGLFKTHDVTLERNVSEPNTFHAPSTKREGGFRRPPALVHDTRDPWSTSSEYSHRDH